MTSPFCDALVFNARVLNFDQSTFKQTNNMGSNTLGDVVASRLVQLPPDCAVRVQVLAGDIVLCSFMVASCYGNWDKLRPDRPLRLYADFA